MQKQVETLRRAGPFIANLTGRAQLTGTSVSLAVPRVLTTVIAADDANSPVPAMAKPMIQALGGFTGYFAEGGVADVGKVQYGFVILPIPKKNEQAAAIPGLLEGAIKAVAPDAAWSNVEVETPEGDKKLAWKQVRFEAPQPFLVSTPLDQGIGPHKKNLPGITNLWSHEDEHYLVLMAFTVPTEMEAQVKLLELAPLVAGTLQVAPPPAPADAPAAAKE